MTTEGLDKQPDWEAVQKKTFAKWINSKNKSSAVVVKDIIGGDLSDGVVLAMLLSNISTEHVKVNSKAKLRIQKIENVNKCLDCIKRHKIKLLNISSEDIVDGRKNPILGLIWMLIISFAVTEENFNLREGLTIWSNTCLEPYKKKIDNFSSDFADGKVYCYLLHSQDNSCIDIDKVNEMTDKERVAHAFEVAENRFNIAPLLDVEDVVDTGLGPDDKSNMTYISSFFNEFSQKNSEKRCLRRVSNFGLALKAVQEMRDEYVRRTRALIESINKVLGIWENVTFTGTFADISEKQNSFGHFKSGEKRNFILEKGDVFTIYSNLTTKCRTYNFKTLPVPDDVKVEKVDEIFNNFAKKELEHHKLLKNKSREVKSKILNDYVSASTTFSASVKDITKKLAALSGDLRSQETEAKNLLASHESSHEKKLPCLKSLWDSSVEAGVVDDESITDSYDDLEYEASLLKAALDKKLIYIAHQIEISEMSNINATHVKMYQSTFSTFDKDKNGKLSPKEFQAAAAGLGINIPDDKLPAQFDEVRDTEEEVSLQAFMDFMRKHEEDQANASQVCESARALVPNSKNMTYESFKDSKLPAETKESVIKEAGLEPGNPFDFEKFVVDIFE